MKFERSPHLEDADANKANVYCLGRVYGHGKLLELCIPRARNGVVLSEGLSSSAQPAGRDRRAGRRSIRIRSYTIPGWGCI